jgi:hypothetical protein
MSVTGCLGVFLFLYWLLCRSLRFRRRDHIANTFKGRDLYSLTIDEAQWILLQIVHSELPAMSRLGTSFALFRTYGICTIADILAR